MTSRDDELFISVDIETDDPCPIVNSMLSIGAVAFTIKNGILNFPTFEMNLSPLPEAKSDPHTMKWWQRNSEAYTKVTKDQIEPKLVMGSFSFWLQKLKSEHRSPQRPVFAAWPAGFDFTFVYTYFYYFGLPSPFGFQAWDAKTAAYMLVPELSFRETVKKNVPEKYRVSRSTEPHTAGADALAQAELFLKILRNK